MKLALSPMVDELVGAESLGSDSSKFPRTMVLARACTADCGIARGLARAAAAITCLGTLASQPIRHRARPGRRFEAREEPAENQCTCRRRVCKSQSISEIASPLCDRRKAARASGGIGDVEPEVLLATGG